MNNRKIYINRDDILNTLSNPNGNLTSAYKGQMCVDADNNFYYSTEANSTKWACIMASPDGSINFEQLLMKIDSKIDNVTIKNVNNKQTLVFISNEETIIEVPLGSADAFDGITAENDKDGNKILKFSVGGEVKHTVNLGNLDGKFDGAAITTNDTESEYYLELLSGDETKVKLTLPATGGGGGGTLLPTLTSDFPETTLGSVDDVYEITYFFTSPNIGKGTAHYMVDSEETTESIRQGDNKFTVGPLSKGEHTIRISVVDVAGAFSNQLTFKIISGGLEITSTFDDSGDLELDNNVVIDYNISTIDPDQTYKCELTLDGVTETIENISMGPHTWEIGALDKGVHTATIKAYSNKLKSNVLSFSLVVTDTTSLYVSTTFKDTEITVGKVPVVDYRISMKDMKKFNVYFYIDGNEVMQAEANIGTNFWSVGELALGKHTLAIKATTLDGLIESNTLQIPLEVVSFNFTPLEIVSDGLVFNFDGRDNNNSSKTNNIWKDRSPNNVECRLHNFNFTGNGWQGETLKFNGDAYAEINYKPFEGIIKNGLTLEIKYKVENIGNLDARVMDCALQKTPFTGVYIDTRQAVFHSALKEISVYTPENRFNTISFVIDRKTGLMAIYANGILTKISWIASNESFNMAKTIFLGGMTDDSFTTKYINSTHVSIGSINSVGELDETDINTVTTNEPINGSGSFTLETSYSTTLIDSIHFYNAERYLSSIRNINASKFTIDMPATATGMKISYKKADGSVITTAAAAGLVRKSDDDILNSSSCEIQTIRMYNRTLTADEIVNNFIADEHDPDAQMELRNLNYDPDGMPTMYFYGDMTGISKKNRVQLRIRYLDPKDPSKSFDKLNCKVQWQGTSTLAYAVKNYKIRLFDENDIKTKEYRKIKDDWFPETVFTLKADYMDSTHIHNTGLCRYYSNLYDEPNPSQQMQPKVRNQIDGFPMLLYINGRLEGIYNFNLDKNAVTLGYEQFVPAEEWCNSNGEYDEYIAGGGNLELNEWLKTLKGVREVVSPDYVGYNKKKHVKINSLALSEDLNDSMDKLKIAPKGTKEGDLLVENTRVMSYEVSANSDVGAGAFKTDEWGAISTEFEIRYHPDEDNVLDQLNGVEVLKAGCHPELQELVTWVATTDDARFKAEFNQHFNFEYVCKYFLSVFVFGMVDNFGKNMMLTTWDGKIWYPQFYDLDTVLGVDNTGLVRFGSDVDFIKDRSIRHPEAPDYNNGEKDTTLTGDYNTSQSELWTKFQRCFETEIKEMYFELRRGLFTPEKAIDSLITNGVNKISQLQCNRDAIQKYLPYGDEYVHMLNGSMEGFMRKWLVERFIYMDSIFEFGNYTVKQSTVRANKEDLVHLRLRSYSPLYVKVEFSGEQGNFEKRLVTPDGFTEFTGRIKTNRDNEIKIYGVDNLMYIDGIKDVEPSTILISDCEKLVELDCSGSPNLRSLQLANNRLLQKLVCKDCQYLGDTSKGGNPVLSVAGSQHLKYLDASNTQLSSVVFGTGGALKYCNLSNTKLRSLEMAGQQHLPALELANCPELASVNLSKCDKLSSLNLPATNLSSIVIDDCKSLESIDLSLTPNLNVIDLVGCPGLKDLKVTGVTNNEVTELDLMYCQNLESLDMSNCGYITSVRFASGYTGLKSFKAANSGITAFRFGTESINPYLDLSRFDLGDISFYNCTNVVEIRGISLNATNSSPFYNCKNLRKIVGDVKLIGSADQAFYGCEKLESFPNLDLTEATLLNETFKNCKLMTREIFESIMNQLGKARILYRTFEGCVGIVYSVEESFPSDLLSKLANVEEFSNVFEGCSNMMIKQIPYDFFAPMRLLLRLKYPFCVNTVHGIIPDDILRYNTELEEVNGLFDHQPNMTGGIPASLFARCPKLTSVRGTFLSSYGLSGEIPPSLFANNPELINVSDCFSGASGLTGSVPASIFAQNRKLQNARWCFENTGLTGSVPETLFSNCPDIQDIGYLFSGSQISGPLPSGFIKNKKSLINIDRLFFRCNIGGEDDNYNEFPVDFFEGLSSLQSAKYAFADCTKIKFTLPSKLFKDCINLRSIDFLFYNCKGIRGTLAEDVFVIGDGSTKPIRSAESVLDGCSGIVSTLPANFMAPFVNVPNLSGFFSGCANITGEIPTDLLKDCTGLIYANRFFKGTGLGKHRVDSADPYFIHPDFFKYNVNLEEVNGLFDAADAPRNLIGAIPADLFRYNVNLRDAGSAFANCTGITGELTGSHFRYNSKLTSVENMFFNSSISKISSDLFTLANNPSMNNFATTFKGLANLTGTAPALWDLYPAANRNECFKDCTNLDNYASIPESWK